MLLDIGGKPLIVRTWEQVHQAETIGRVIVATDDERIFDVITSAGGEAIMTSPDHNSGSDRVAEIAVTLPPKALVVNVQGDEPVIPPDTIDKAVRALIDDPNADVATTCEQFTGIAELLNDNNVKVVVGDKGYAVYFSRSPMPWPREAALRYGGDLIRTIENEPGLLSNFRKHTGLYVYRREYLLEFTNMPQTRLEQFEMLEQLRALEYGARIRVVDVNEPSIGVDTLEDLERVRSLVEQNG